MGTIWTSLFGAPGARSIFLSVSRENAQTALFGEAAHILRHSPALAGLAEVQVSRIGFGLTGGEVLTVPCTMATAGIGVTGLLVTDELWAAPSEEPFHLLASQSEAGKVLVISQAAGLGSYVRRLYDLHEAGAEGADLRVDYFRPEAGVLSPNPTLTAQYLASRRAELPETLFRSYFENDWREGADAAFRAEDLERAVRGYSLPTSAEEWAALRGAFPGSTWTIGSGLDRAQPGSRHGDKTVYATVARRSYTDEGGFEREQYQLVGLELLRFGTEFEVLGAHERAKVIFGGPHATRFEAYQAADVAGRCGAELVHATAPLQGRMFGLLVRLVAEGGFLLPGEGVEELQRELGAFGCSLPGGGAGALPRWGGMGGAHDDHVYAVGHALLAAADAVGPRVFHSVDDILL
jgi:hypothetical protein